MKGVSLHIKNLLQKHIDDFAQKAEKVCESWCDRNYPEFKSRVKLKIEITPIILLESKTKVDRDPQGGGAA